MNESGKRVAIIDNRPYGGTCALQGCQPKKYFVVNTNLAAEIRALAGKGMLRPPDIDWQSLQSFKREFTKSVSQNTEQSFQEQGIATFAGTARFSTPNTIILNETG